MFEKFLKTAFDSGSDAFVFINGFAHPLRGRVQDLEEDYFTFFQSGRSNGTVLWAFRKEDILSCGLIVGPPSAGDGSECNLPEFSEESSLGYLNENDN
jgi:hypothetical protein